MPITPNTLTARAMRMAVVRIGLVAVAAGVFSYYVNSHQIEKSVRAQLLISTQERLQREAVPFLEIQDRNRNGLEALLSLSQNTARHEELLGLFDQFFILRPDGAWVSRDALYDGMPLADGHVYHHLTAALNPGVPLTRELKIRMAASVLVVEDYGNQGRGRHLDFGIIFPEGGLTLYWPGVRYCTELVFEGPKAYRMQDQDWFKVGFAKPGPGQSRTRMYLDTPSGNWLVSIVGRCAPGPDGFQPASTITDLSLANLMERTAKPSISGTDNVVFRADAEGSLIVHPELREQIQKNDGRASIISTGNTELMPILKEVASAEFKAGAPRIISSPNHIIAYGVIPGTDWVLAVRYPKALMRPAIMSNLGIVAAVGLVTLLVEIFLLRSILQNQVARPLDQLIRATRRLGDSGADFDVGQLPPSSPDEIGRLSESFRKMAEQLRASFASVRGSEEKFHTVLNTSPLAISWMNSRGEMEFWNRKALDLFGYDREEIDTAEKWFNLAYPDPEYRKVVIDRWNTSGAAGPDGPINRGEYDITCKDGRVLTMEIVGTRLGDLTLAFFNDISERKLAEVELLRHRDHMEELVAARTCELAEANTSLEKTVHELGLNQYMLDKATTGIYLIDRSGKFIYVNECAAHYAGYTREELLGMNVSDINIAHTPEGWDQRWHTVHALPEGELDVVRMIHRRKDGSTFPIEILAHHIRHEGLDYQLSIGIDISEREQAEARLQRALALNEQAMELTRSGYWSVPLDGSTHYISSERAAAIFGDTPNPEWRYSLADWRACIESVSPEIAEATGETFAKACSGETPVYDVTYPYKRPSDGRVVWLHNLGVIIRDESGRPPEMYGVCQDITEIVEARREIEAARKAAEQANKLKSEFLANMSHEIRTPMNGVLGMAELLYHTQLQASQREQLAMLKSSAEDLLSIISDILDFSKIEAGRLELETIGFSLHDLLGRALQALGTQAAAKKLEIELDIPDDLPDLRLGDPNRLRQVLTNLTGNAIKFTAHGWVRVVITQGQGQGPHDFRVAVTDTGEGISPEAQAKLFKPFSQADASTTRKHGGTGLGLVISARIIEQMGGRIGVISEPGRGSTFWFELALPPAAPEQVTGLDDRMPALSQLAGKRVLLVDDNAVNRAVAGALMRRWGMKVVEVADGPTALAQVRAAVRTDDAGYDLAVLDGAMPGMDGWQLAAAIREVPGCADIPMVMASSSGLESSHSVGENSLFRRFLLKPLRPAQLAGALGEALTGWQPRRAAPILKAARVARVLLVEDTKVNQMVARAMLEKGGHQVTLAENGVEALAQLELPGLFDIILMDCQMPEMDGFEATRQLRRREQERGWQPYHVVAMTANAMESDREACLEAGMDDYLSKPVRMDQLLKTVTGDEPKTRNAFEQEVTEETESQ